MRQDPIQGATWRQRGPRYAPRPSTLGFCRLGSGAPRENLCLAIRDLSPAGACLLLRRQLGPGEEVELTLISPLTFHCQRVIAVVVWQTPGKGAGEYVTGVRFRCTLNPVDLEEYVFMA
jgi:hypothetical protein